MKHNSNTDFMAESKYGLLLHYLKGMQSGEGNNWSGGLPAVSWNECVNAFDVKKFAENVVTSGAGFVVFTAVQNSGYPCAPSAKYDKYCGPGYCSERDLISEIADELAKHDIKTMVYFPACAPMVVPEIIEKLDYIYNGKSYDETGYSPNNYRLFRDKWFDIVLEYSCRWGDKISGWWIDGCGDIWSGGSIWNNESLSEFSAALKKGNPNAVVAFNAQNLHPYPYEWVTQGIVHAWNDVEDYTTGESFVMNVTPFERWINGIQWNMTIYLGESWADPAVKYSNEVWIEFMRKVFDKRGSIMFDACLRRDGTINPEQLKQLSAFKREFKKNR